MPQSASGPCGEMIRRKVLACLGAKPCWLALEQPRAGRSGGDSPSRSTREATTTINRDLGLKLSLALPSCAVRGQQKAAHRYDVPFRATQHKDPAAPVRRQAPCGHHLGARQSGAVGSAIGVPRPYDLRSAEGRQCLRPAHPGRNCASVRCTTSIPTLHRDVAAPTSLTPLRCRSLSIVKPRLPIPSSRESGCRSRTMGGMHQARALSHRRATRPASEAQKPVPNSRRAVIATDAHQALVS